MTIALGEIRLTPDNFAGAPLTLLTDPDTVETVWDPRTYLTEGLEGTMTSEHAGQFAIDCIRRLRWAGQGQWLDRAAIRQLREWLALRGARLRYEDYEGNDWTVELVPPFQADADFRIAGAGLADLYTASLTVHVLSMYWYLGALYTGE